MSDEYWDKRAACEYNYKGEKFYTMTAIPYYYERRNEIIKKIKSIICNGMSVCDFGCGDGVYVREFAQTYPNITPHVCRHTYCSNMAKSGMNPKTLQYLMGHSDIGVTLNTYTHLGLQDAKDEMERLKDAQKELDKDKVKELPSTKTKFRIV